MPARLGVGGRLLVRVAKRLVILVPEQGGVVEGDLGVEADEALLAGARPLAHDREGIDLHEIRVVGEHRPDEALGDPDGRLQVGVEPEPECELARLPVTQPEQRVRVDADDGVRVRRRHLLDLDPALGRAHQQDPPRRPIEDRGQVQLADDVRGWSDEDLAHGDALDRHAEDVVRDVLRLVVSGGEPDAARLASTADEHLRLDHHLARVARAVEQPGGRSASLGRAPGDLPGRNRQTLGEQELLGVGFLDLHGWPMVRAGRVVSAGPGAACGPRRSAPARPVSWPATR